MRTSAGIAGASLILRTSAGPCGPGTTGARITLINRSAGNDTATGGWTTLHRASTGTALHGPSARAAALHRPWWWRRRTRGRRRRCIHRARAGLRRNHAALRNNWLLRWRLDYHLRRLFRGSYWRLLLGRRCRGLRRGCRRRYDHSDWCLRRSLRRRRNYYCRRSCRFLGHGRRWRRCRLFGWRNHHSSLLCRGYYSCNGHLWPDKSGFFLHGWLGRNRRSRRLRFRRGNHCWRGHHRARRRGWVLLLLLPFAKQPGHIARLGYLGKINLGLDLRGRRPLTGSGRARLGRKMPPERFCLIRFNRAGVSFLFRYAYFLQHIQDGFTFDFKLPG